MKLVKLLSLIIFGLVIANVIIANTAADEIDGVGRAAAPTMLTVAAASGVLFSVTR
jgi:hypothetical protein